MSTAENLWLWASENVLSLKALHIPRRENRGADLMSRGGPLPDEWMLHPEVVKQIWARSVWESGGGPVRQPAQQPLYPMVFPGSAGQSTLGGGRVCTRAMAEKAALRLSTAASHSPPPGEGEMRTIVSHPGSPRSPPWYAELTQMMVGQPWTVPQVWGALPTLGQPLQAWLLRGTG